MSLTVFTTCEPAFAGTGQDAGLITHEIVER